MSKLNKYISNSYQDFFDKDLSFTDPVGIYHAGDGTDRADCPTGTRSLDVGVAARGSSGAGSGRQRGAGGSIDVVHSLYQRPCPFTSVGQRG